MIAARVGQDGHIVEVEVPLAKGAAANREQIGVQRFVEMVPATVATIGSST